MTLQLNRRALAAGLLATTVTPAIAVTGNATSEPGERLPDHAAFWSRLPLPWTPAEAWARLSPTTQAEIGAAVIGMALAEYIAGEDYADENRFLDADLRDDAWQVNHDLLNGITPRLWSLFPELYGPEGDHPRWALAGGFAR